MKPIWRLLVHEPADGYTNMAIDEALLRAHAAGTAPPTVRFFRWHPCCVSLGYFQSALTEVNLAECRRLGIDCVRRPTGGRAIVHDAELTYSVVARMDNPVISGSILESYRKISLALLQGLKEMGVPAEMKPLTPAAYNLPEHVPGGDDTPGSGRRVLTAACFDVPSDYEIAVAGRKLIGSAQTRQDGVILQHGSLMLEVDVAQIFTALNPPRGRGREEVTRWLAGRVTSLHDVLGRVVTFEEAAEFLRRGFSSALDISLEQGQLSRDELQLAEELRTTKYATKEWNLKR